ncbi:MAG: replicative DNA helicase [Clostridia bacterium]
MAKENKTNISNNISVSARSLPHNIDAEICLIGCILVDGVIALDVCDLLVAEDFYSPAHALIFRAIKQLAQSNKAVDVITLTDCLIRSGEIEKVGGAAYIMTVASSVPSSANYKEYLDIVTRSSSMRRLIHSCSSIIDSAYSANDAQNTIAEAEKMIFDVNSKTTSNDIQKLSETLGEVMTRINILKDDKTAFKGVPTGFWALDELTNGLHAGELVIIAARPSVGKSALAMNIVENAAKKGLCSAIFSLEMPKIQIAQRLLASCAGVPLSQIAVGNLSDAQWSALFSTSTTISKFNIFIDDSSLITPSQILSKCRKLKSQFGLNLVVIDYIQLMSSGKRNIESRQQEVSEISRSLKIMAKELNVPILALSQMSRQVVNRTDNTPQLSDLRESGAIEQDADIVMFIHIEKSETDSKDTDKSLIVAKNRNGPLDTIPLKWIGELVRFTSYSSEEFALKKQFAKNEQEKKNNKKNIVNNTNTPIKKDNDTSNITSNDNSSLSNINNTQNLVNNSNINSDLNNENISINHLIKSDGSKNSILSSITDVMNDTLPIANAPINPSDLPEPPLEYYQPPSSYNDNDIDSANDEIVNDNLNINSILDPSKDDNYDDNCDDTNDDNSKKSNNILDDGMPF